MKPYHYFKLLVAVFVMAVVFSALKHTLFRIPPFSASTKLEVGVPLVMYNDQEYLCAIDDVLVSDSYVYVLFSEMHIIKVYDTDQKYLCTIVVSDKKAHGSHALIYAYNNCLYIQAGHDIYEFADLQFVRFYTSQDAATLSAELNMQRTVYQKRMTETHDKYYIKGESVYRKDKDGNESIFLERSPFYFVCRPIFSWLLWALFFILFITPTLIKTKR